MTELLVTPVLVTPELGLYSVVCPWPNITLSALLPTNIGPVRGRVKPTYGGVMLELVDERGITLMASARSM